MVEGVGLVASSFQFFSRLAAMFPEECGGFGVVVFNRSMQRESIHSNPSHSHPYQLLNAV